MMPHRDGQAGRGWSDEYSGNLDIGQEHKISFGSNIS